MDLEDTLGNYIGKQPTKDNTHLSGYNGGDEDEIMDKVFNNLAVAALDSYNNKTGQKVITKKNARRSAEILLEACHKLDVKDVPEYVKKNFDETWKNYD